jgi:hypothetical protein
MLSHDFLSPLLISHTLTICSVKVVLAQQSLVSLQILTSLVVTNDICGESSVTTSFTRY